MALARLLSLVEDGDPGVPEAVRALFPNTGGAYVVGVTGAPGAGKSTLTDGLIACIRAQGRRAGVLAVDPTSPFSGGALLGDRVRMQAHATDPGVFIRSMASRGHLGGLSLATPDAIRVLDAAGFDVVLVETVGVGQGEVEIAGSADTTVVVVNPGWGDAVQTWKAGLLEIADVFAINKADRPGLRETVRQLEQSIALGPHTPWRPPLIETVATEGSGLESLWEAIAAHRAHLERSGELGTRRRRRIAQEIAGRCAASLRRRVELEGQDTLESLAERVAARELDPREAGRRLLATLGYEP
ncbi:MAG: methylmalonyl Co-A mutase-associated GTPase MeaB [Actinomycetota bacterium]